MVILICTAISTNLTAFAIVQLTSASTRQLMAEISMPIKGALSLFWSVLVLGSKPSHWWHTSKSILLPLWPIWQQPPNHGGCCPIAAEILVGYWQMTDRIEALHPLDQLESSSVHSAAIMAFKLAALLSPLAHAGRRHRQLSWFWCHAAATTTRYCWAIECPSLSYVFINLDDAHSSDEESWKRWFKRHARGCHRSRRDGAAGSRQCQWRKYK